MRLGHTTYVPAFPDTMQEVRIFSALSISRFITISVGCDAVTVVAAEVAALSDFSAKPWLASDCL